MRLLAPAQHADGKSDRLYRGYLELIPASGGLTVVNVVELECYLLGVVPSEMCAWYPLDALKAQAIAARTYALKNIGRFSSQGFDLTDTASSQVYGGYCSEDPHSTRAVEETTGIVLTYNGDLIDAVYSSTCGGFTECASEAWGHAVPYLRGIADFDRECNATLTHPETEDAWTDYFKTVRATALPAAEIRPRGGLSLGEGDDAPGAGGRAAGRTAGWARCGTSCRCTAGTLDASPPCAWSAARAAW